MQTDPTLPRYTSTISEQNKSLELLFKAPCKHSYLRTVYETLGNSKAGTIQLQLDVEPTVTLHNLLFLVQS